MADLDPRMFDITNLAPGAAVDPFTAPRPNFDPNTTPVVVPLADPGASPLGHLHVGNTPDGDAIVQHADGAPLVVSQQAREAAKVPDRSSFFAGLGSYKDLAGAPPAEAVPLAPTTTASGATDLGFLSGLGSYKDFVSPDGSPQTPGPVEGKDALGPPADLGGPQKTPPPQPTVQIPPSAQPTNGQPQPPAGAKPAGGPAKPDQGERDLNAASAQADKAIEEGKQADIQKAQAEQEGLQNQADYNTATAAALQKQHTAQSQAEGAELQKLGQLQQGLSKQAAVDPARWWNSRDTFQKASAGLGMILENFAAAIGHRPVRDYVKDFTEQDIQAQKDSFEHAKSAFDAAQSNYGMLRQKGLNDQQATLLMRNAGLDAVTAHAKAMAAASGVPQAIANADKLAAMNHLDKVKNIQAYHQAQQGLAQGAEALKQQKMQTQIMQNQIASQGNPNRPLSEGEVDVHGQRFRGLEKGAATKIVGEQAAGDTARAYIMRARSALHDMSSADAAHKTEAYGRYRAAVMGLKKLQNQSEGINSVVSESENKDLDELVSPDFLKTGSGRADSALGEFYDGIGESVNNLHRRYKLPEYYAAAPQSAQRAAP